MLMPCWPFAFTVTVALVVVASCGAFRLNLFAEYERMKKKDRQKYEI